MAKLNECIIIWETEKGKGDWHALGFDGVKVETHNGENILTQYPVSSGFNVSEHTIRQNSKIILDAVISNISWSVSTVRQSYDAAFEALCSAAGGSSTLNNATKFGRLKGNTEGVLGAFTADIPDNKVNESFNEIVKLTRLGTVIHLLTMRGLYTNCVIRNYTAANDVSNSYSLPVVLNIEQMVLIGESKQGSILSTTSDDDGSNVFNDFLSLFGGG